MPLDPDVKTVLDLLASLGNPPMSEVTPAEARAMYDAFRTPGGDQTVQTQDVTIEGPHGDIPARVYTPAGGEGPRPIVVHYHGGGWVIGSVETHDPTCRDLAAAADGIVVSVDYRLAPEHPFPVPLDEAYAALEWVAAKAADLGGDAGRLAVAGDSAGGNLAAALCLLARERGGPAISYQLLVYPVTDITFDYPSHEENGSLNYILSSRALRWFTDHYVGGVEGVDWRAAPNQANDLSGLPPTFVVTAELDPLRDEGEAYARRLEEAGVPVTVIRGAGMIHGFYGFPVDEALRIRKEVATALRQALQV